MNDDTHLKQAWSVQDQALEAKTRFARGVPGTKQKERTNMHDLPVITGNQLGCTCLALVL